MRKGKGRGERHEKYCYYVRRREGRRESSGSSIIINSKTKAYIHASATQPKEGCKEAKRRKPEVSKVTKHLINVPVHSFSHLRSPKKKETKHNHTPETRNFLQGQLHTCFLSFHFYFLYSIYHHFTHLLHPPAPPSLPASTTGAGGGSAIAAAAAAATDATRARSSPSWEGMRLRVGVLSRRATSLSTPSKASTWCVYQRWICIEVGREGREGGRVGDGEG